MSLSKTAGVGATLRRWGRAALVTSVALALSSLAAAAPPIPEVQISGRGIGPLLLGVPLLEASRQTRPLDPAAAMIGPGCDERDQITVVLQFAGEAMTVMAMANAEGRIEEILATPAGNAGVKLADAEACRAHGAEFATRLAPALGAMQAWSVQHKPVSTEFNFVFGQQTEGRVRLVSRWFAGGRTCDLLLQFGGRSAGP